jgi:ABC-type branched-subunit amino acid transport system permease subunit
MGLSWNMLSGYGGLISFGHAAFFGLGAYTVVLLLVHFGITPWIGIPVGMVVGMAAGVLIGFPTFRLRGHYFALAMLAYPLALLYVFEWLGYQEVSLPMKREAPAAFMQFQDYRWYVGIALVMLVAAMASALKIARSRFGLSLLAIKQNEPAAEAAGINTLAWKMRAIMVSGAIAAGAGGFYAVVLLIVTPPSVFGMLTSAQALIVTLFGGVATVWGPVVGAAILIPLSEVLNAELGDKLPGIQGVVFGVAIVLVILLAPEGIVPHLREAVRRRRGERAGRSPCNGRLGCRSSTAHRDRARASYREQGGGAHGRKDLQGVWRLASGRGCEFRRAQRRGAGHHRPKRRWQDHPLQRAERLHSSQCWSCNMGEGKPCWSAAERNLPARHRAHVSSGASICAHDGAAQRGRGRVRGRT